MGTMKAAVFVEQNRIVLEDKPIPEVGPQDALIRITTTTICGTDVHTVSARWLVTHRFKLDDIEAAYELSCLPTNGTV
jgi:threonine dehydrogenase-like Zn-dependent dehydrogenase